MFNFLQRYPFLFYLVSLIVIVGTFTIVLVQHASKIIQYNNAAAGSETCVHNNPIVTVTPSVQSGKAGQTQYYIVSVKNTDNSLCNPSELGLSSIAPISDSNWNATFNTSSLTLAPGVSDYVTMTVVSPSSASDGSSEIKINVGDASDGTRQSSVTTSYMVSNNLAPSASITSPAFGERLSSTVSIQASGPAGLSVAKAELYVNETLTDTFTPTLQDASTSTDILASYTFSWNTTAMANGPASLKIRTYDSDGNSTDSSVTVFIVNNPQPHLSLSPQTKTSVLGPELHGVHCR